MKVLAKLELIFHHVKEYGNRGSSNCWKVREEKQRERGKEKRREREGKRNGGRERERETEGESGERKSSDSKLCGSMLDNCVIHYYMYFCS